MSSSLSESGRPAEILLVEDNDNDTELMRLAFKQAKLLVRVHRVADGEECMAFLRKQPPFENTPVPDLIFLDLNMPRMDGREVMQEILKDDQLRHLPVIVMTSSDADADVLASYRLRCSSYIVKPIGFENFAQVIRSLSSYWFTVVVLPTTVGTQAVSQHHERA
jgi:two-component system, chemotaxis family, response regulator Rcp1